MQSAIHTSRLGTPPAPTSQTFERPVDWLFTLPDFVCFSPSAQVVRHRHSLITYLSTTLLVPQQSISS